MSEQPKKINRELMLAVAKHIRQHPESFMMAHVMTTEKETSTFSWKDEAAEVLGLPIEFAEKLFDQDLWPPYYSLTYESAKDDVTRANITAQLLENIAHNYQEGQTDWWN